MEGELKRQGTTEQIQFRVTDSGSLVTGLATDDFRVNIVKPSGVTLKYPSGIVEQDAFHAPGVYELTLAPEDLDEEGGYGVLIRPRSDWVPSELTGHDTLLDVDFVSASEGWAVGKNGTILHTTDGGDSWTTQTSNTTNDLYAVDALGASEVYAVGENETLLSYDGSWSTVTTAGTAVWYDLSADGSSDVVVVEDTGKTIRWDGSAKVTLEDGTVSGGSALRAVFKPDSSTYLVSGVDGTIIRTTDDGFSWSSISSGTSETLRDIYFPTASEGWIAGDTGTILHSTDTGASWSSQSTPVGLRLNSVQFADTSTGWAVGESGVLLETTNGGSTWVRDTTAQHNEIYGSYVFSTSSALFVGGDQETVVIQGKSSPASFDDVFETFEVGDPVADKVDRLLGLSKENYRITDQQYDENNNLEQAKVSIYDSKADTVNMVNPVAEYTIKAFYDTEGRLNDYRMTKD